MSLKKLTPKKRPQAAELLWNYWKERGMPQYDKKWAEDYLVGGHKKEIKKDEFYVYEDRAGFIGLVSLIVDVSGVAEIRDMVIDPMYRKKGYGTRMLNDLIEFAKKENIRKVFALVIPQYENLYRKMGFEKEGILKNHFAAGEDLIIMSKFL